jgi:trk system potassium uptake protein TrkA
LARTARHDTVVVIGLGRFGTAVARQLHLSGHEVMGIDVDEKLVRAAMGFLDFAEIADSTDNEALVQLGVMEVQHAVVGIGANLQASILTVANLSAMGGPRIWAKAQTAQHRDILRLVGADDIVFPEEDMGERVAHRVGGLLDYVRLADGLTIVGHKREGGAFAIPSGSTVLGGTDVIVVAGGPEDIEAFSRLR